MHMADALLSPAVGLAMDAVSVAAIGISVAKVKRDELNEKKIPVMGLAGAMVFAGQMVNFTIPATGSSGHICGGILLAGLLGGAPAFLSLTAVLIIQCLFFADGGLLALGCNIFNIGALPCLLIYPLIFKPFCKGSPDNRSLSIASVLSATAGLSLGAFCIVIQTLLSGVTALPFSTFAALMLPIHFVIGLIEGTVTAAVLCFVFKMRPELIDVSPSGKNLNGVSIKKTLVVLTVATVLTGGALSLFASAHPDGLEWALEKAASGIPGPEAGQKTAAGTSAAGLIGAAITFLLAGSAGLVISKVKKSRRIK